MRYTLFVDESGDQGLDKVRGLGSPHGASPYMTLGACLVPDIERSALLSLLDRLASEFKKTDLHCNELNHFQIAKFSRTVAREARVKLFAIVSKKSTLGTYKNDISGKGQDQRYYNKCVQYLLERVGEFMLINNISSDSLSIVFETRERHNYQALRAYIRKIIRSPIDERAARFLARIDPLSITDQTKLQQKLLSYADLVAYASYQAVNDAGRNLGVPEQRYMRELKDKFFADEATGLICEKGAKLLMMRSMQLDEVTAAFFSNLKVKNQS